VGPLGWIVVGLIAGVLARTVVKDDRTGCIYTIVVGVLGALIGGAIAGAAGHGKVTDFSLRSVIIAFLGACLLLLVLQAISGRGRSRR
jgi:uncharacterized membrane protein YeaQ/YmgE (transglycosylase-associated protein family)